MAGKKITELTAHTTIADTDVLPIEAASGVVEKATVTELNTRFNNNVLKLDNTTAFTPNADYEPATKKYVDDEIASNGWTSTLYVNNPGVTIVWSASHTFTHNLSVTEADVLAWRYSVLFMYVYDFWAWQTFIHNSLYYDFDHAMEHIRIATAPASYATLSWQANTLIVKNYNMQKLNTRIAIIDNRKT